jgi:octopine/nopaline transport system substrate-binding protein
MSWKKLKLRLLAAAIALPLAGFAIPHPAAAEQTVTIALEGSYQPWNLTNPDGSLGGFEPELAANLCARMKVKCVLIAQNWDGMIAALSAGKFDVIMDALSITPDREKVMDFSIPYANTPAAFVVDKTGPLATLPDAGNIFTYTGINGHKAQLAALRAALKGKTIGIQAGTVYAPFIYATFKDVAKIREYNAASDRDLDIINDRIDVGFDDATYFGYAMKSPGDANLAFAGPIIGGTIWGPGEGLGLRKNEGALAAKFNVAIRAALADGTVKKLSMKWFGVNVAPK